jgi:hypothetical protein
LQWRSLSETVGWESVENRRGVASP